jgi:2-iminobutanoate/2-iminopropanoate deaminase
MVTFRRNPQEHFQPCDDLFKEYVGDYSPAGILIDVLDLAFHPRHLPLFV